MQNLERHQRLAVVALVAWLFTSFLGAAVGGLSIAALGGTGAIWSTAALDNVDRASTICGILYIVAFLFAVVCVARWIYRASVNAHALSDAMWISPGWSIGWYFVPIANLFKPFQAMREIWQVSLVPRDPLSVPVPGLLRVWWGLWLLTNLLGRVSFQLGRNAHTISDLVMEGCIEVVTFAVDAALAIVLIRIIRQLTANQRSIVDTRIFE